MPFNRAGSNMQALFVLGVGLFFGPLHHVLPFLLLGIGIDDMFVIVQSWDMLSPEDQATFFTCFFKLQLGSD